MKKRVLAVLLAVCLAVQGSGVYAQEAPTVSGSDPAGGETQETQADGETEEAPEETESTDTVSGDDGNLDGEEVEEAPETLSGEGGTETETTVSGNELLMLLEDDGAESTITGFTACSPQELAAGLNSGSPGANASIAGNQVTLLKDIKISGGAPLTYQAGIVTAGLVFELNGHTISGDNNQGAFFITNLSNAADEVTVRNGSIQNQDTSGVGIEVLAPSTKVTLSGVNVTGGDYGIIIAKGALTVESGRCTGRSTAIQKRDDSELTVNGGYFEGRVGFGLEVPTAYKGIKLNSGVFTGGSNSYDSAVYKLSELIASGKTAYHYNTASGSRENALEAELLAAKEISVPFEVADGISSLSDINGSISIKGLDPAFSTVSLNSVTAAGKSFVGAIQADGTYFISGVPDGEYSLGLFIRGAAVNDALNRYGFSVKGGTVVPTGAEQIELGGSRLSGTVYYDDGTPCGEVTVSLESVRDAGVWFENGYYREAAYVVPYIEGGRFAAQLTIPTGEKAVRTIDISTGDNVWNVTFPRSGAAGGVLAVGSVKSTTGDPVNGAAVSITRQADGAAWSVPSNPSGSYTAAGLGDGVYNIRASKNGEGQGEASFTLSGGKIVSGTTNVIIGKGLSGRVTIETADGLPCTGAEIVIKNRATGETHKAMVGADSKYTMEPATDGEYDVILKKDGLEIFYSSIMINAESILSQKNFVAGDATMKGKVTDEKGNPVSGVKVTAVLPGGNTYVMSGGVTKADGTYSIYGLPAGHYTVSAKPSGGTEVNRTADVAKGGTFAADFSFSSAPGTTGGAASGTVSGSDGAPAGGLTVTYTEKNSGVSYQGVTDADGKYRVEALPDGVYSAVITGDGKNLCVGEITVGSGTPSGNMDFAVGSGGIKGIVKGTDGSPVAGAVVTLKHKMTGHTYSLPNTSGADGAYELCGVPDGDYEVTVKAANKQDEISTFTVSGGAIQEKDFSLTPTSGGGGTSGGGDTSGGTSGGGDISGGGTSGGGDASGGGNTSGGGTSGGGVSGDGSHSGSVQAPGGQQLPEGGIPGNAGIPAGQTPPAGGEGASAQGAALPAADNETLTAAGNLAGDNGAAGQTGSQNVRPGTTGTAGSGKTSGPAGAAPASPTVAKSPAGTLKGGLTGENIAQADVTITEKQSGQSFQEKTDDKGEYYFTDLPDGSYSIRITTKDGTVMTADFLLKEGVHTLMASSFRVFAAGEKEPKTGDGVPAAVPVALVGGLAYLMELFCEKKGLRLGMTQAQKDWLVDKIILYARGKNKLVRYLALGLIFALLVFYYSLGRIVDLDAGELLYA